MWALVGESAAIIPLGLVDGHPLAELLASDVLVPSVDLGDRSAIAITGDRDYLHVMSNYPFQIALAGMPVSGGA